MADPRIREIGRIEAEENEHALIIGVDYDSVTVRTGDGSARHLTPAQAEAHGPDPEPAPRSRHVSRTRTEGS